MHNQKKGFKGPGCKQRGSCRQCSHSGGNKNKCRNCGSTHSPKKCPAYGKECFLCKKKGHFKQYCHSTSQNHSSDGRKSRKDMHDIDQDEEVFQMQDYDSVNV